MSPELKQSYSWQVLLIGGSSGVGKTVIARELAKYLSLPLLLLDDIRLALQQATSSKTHPELHVFLSYQSEQWRNSQLILADWLTVGEAMTKPLQAIINHHLVVPEVGAVIIEGDGILPTASHPFLESNAVRGVFIAEENEARLLQNLRSRGRGFQEWNEVEQKGFAHASWLYGQWLTQEAKRAGLPVIDAQPREIFFERLLAAADVK